MNSGLLRSRASITVGVLLMLSTGFAATSAADPAAADLAAAETASEAAAAQAAVRKADTEWDAAAHAGGVDAWTSFYAADAVVLLPHEQPATGKGPVRRSVTRFLALPHLSVTSRPSDGNVAVARSGDLALLAGGYDLRFDGLHGASVSDRGRRLEIWKRQADGSWKCLVDTWISNIPEPAPPPAPPAPEPAPEPAPPAPATLAPGHAAAPAAEAGPPAPKPASTTTYGDMPADAAGPIRKYFLEHLKHPESVRYREITGPDHGYTTEITGGLLMREKRLYGWTVKATIDAQDSQGNYVGFKTYTFLFRGEKIVDIRLPLPGDEAR